MLTATLRLNPDAIALAHTLEEVPSLKVEAERVAAHSTRRTMPCLWITNADFDAVDETIADDPSVSSVIEATEFDDEKLYHLDWSEKVNDRINAYIDYEGSILAAEATGDGWIVQIRFLSRNQFDTFRESLHEREQSFELLMLTQPDNPHHMGGKLTPAQREALHAARERGYYNVPREISTRSLAEELDMSHQNLSKLLRRATETLIDEMREPSADTGDE